MSERENTQQKHCKETKTSAAVSSKQALCLTTSSLGLPPAQGHPLLLAFPALGGLLHPGMEVADDRRVVQLCQCMNLSHDLVPGRLPAGRTPGRDGRKEGRWEGRKVREGGEREEEGEVARKREREGENLILC